MTPTKLAHNAYGKQGVPMRTPRGTEYAAFAQVTRKMQAADRLGPTGFPDLVVALNENRRLWTILAAGVADEDNELPRDLRARLFYLAEFTFHHTRKILAGEAKARPLVEINAAVMRGLMNEGDKG
jgi:flagellar protein FlaF